MTTPRPEYPRPQFVREQWYNLNGEWDFQLDPSNTGLDQKWFASPVFTDKIVVPYAYLAPLSKVKDKTPSDWCWYSRKFVVPDAMCGKQIILHFGAVDYECQVYLNGKMVGTHEGGHTPFAFNITPYLGDREQTLTLRVYDPLYSESIPRGKQNWIGQSNSIWYTTTTGIWQTVWLEAVEKTYIKNVRFTPDVDNGNVAIEATIGGDYKVAVLDIDISFKGEQIVQSQITTTDDTIRTTLSLYSGKVFNGVFHHIGMAWSPENPQLFDVTFKLNTDDKTVDEVSSYFGLRKIHTENGKILLNNRPYYQKLVLDQGYWPEGLLTAPTDEDYIKDIKLTKEMGFNGARKHQKVEDPRFLYWADKLGFLVWGECGAVPSFNQDGVARLTREWLEIVDRDYNHPCIVTWVPFNESWGVTEIARDKQQQAHTLALYYMIKSLDTTRLCISNDGWEMTKTDICAFHTYGHGSADNVGAQKHYQETLRSFEFLQKNSVHRKLYAEGFAHEGEPVMLTEFGGIAYKVDDTSGWGYTTVKSAEELLADYARIIDAIRGSEYLHGFCYTQITDVEQEVNGLLTYDRQPKCDLARIRELNGLVWG